MKSQTPAAIRARERRRRLKLQARISELECELEARRLIASIGEPILDKVLHMLTDDQLEQIGSEYGFLAHFLCG